MSVLHSVADLHVPILLGTLIAIAWADSIAVLWVIGKRGAVSHSRIQMLHRIISTGLASMIITGVLLAYDRLGYLLSEPVFYTKMAFIVALSVNGFLLGRHGKLASTHRFTELSPREKTPLFISGAVSATGWIGAIVCGLLL